MGFFFLTLNSELNLSPHHPKNEDDNDEKSSESSDSDTSSSDFDADADTVLLDEAQTNQYKKA